MYFYSLTNFKIIWKALAVTLTDYDDNNNNNNVEFHLSVESF
jgi:hypothetical protein